MYTWNSTKRSTLFVETDQINTSFSYTLILLFFIEKRENLDQQ